MGHLFSKNDERGVFRTMDGGKTWKKVLYVNDGVGAIDLVINRKIPATLYAAMYDKDRMPWQIIESGPESGIYRTDDGGDKWTKLAGGLPTGKIGRIGLDIYQKNPLHSVRARSKTRIPQSGADAARRQRRQPARRRHHRQRALSHRRWRQDVAASRRDVNVAGGKAPYSFNQIRIDPRNDKRVIVTSDSMYITRDGGKTWTTVATFFRGVVRRLPRDVVGSRRTSSASCSAATAA